jgi:DNA repair exonuclease SbcCD nuclease subunit
MKFLEHYMTVIDEPTVIFDGKVLALPWVVDGEMWDNAIKLSKTSKVDYMFAHLELNGFKVNDSYEMEHGQSPKELSHLKHVYTGHYHSPQTKENITYCGTPIPITMNEANEAHGIYFLDLDTGVLEFVEYKGVNVLSIPYDKLEDILDEIDPENTYLRVEFPDDLEDETIISDVQALLTELKVSEFKIQHTPSAAKLILEGDVGTVENVENIDAVVLKFLDESNKIASVDNEILKAIYQEAMERETE